MSYPIVNDVRTYASMGPPSGARLCKAPLVRLVMAIVERTGRETGAP